MQIAVFAVIGVIAMIIGLVLLLVLPALILIALGIIALGLILVASAGIIEFRRVRSAIASKRGKFSTSTVILVSVFTSIVLLVNAISVSDYHRFDFTGLSKFTLTQQTKDVLAKLDTPVDVLCFFVPEVKNVPQEYADIYKLAAPYALVLLQEYGNYTNELSIKIIDPEQHPEQAAKYGIADISYYQSVVFETAQGTRLVTAPYIYSEAENSFTGAIMEVTGIKQKMVYFLTGHGEASPSDSGSTGYSDAYQALRDNLYQVQALDLLATPEIPDDCAVLVIAGPKQPMSDSEKQIITDYLHANGTVIFLTNPGAPDDIAELLIPWGINVLDGTVVDPASYNAPNKTTPIITRDRNWFGLTTLYFPGITAIVPDDAVPENMDLYPMLQTSDGAWLTKEYDPSIDQPYDPDKDIKGPLYVGYFTFPKEDTPATDSEPAKTYEGPAIAIIGDSDFASNTNFMSANNSELFVKIVGGFAASGEVISIQRKVLQTRRLILTPEKENFLRISSIALLPAVVLVIGVAIWWQRRR
jgi:ABC-type uncharacterized transport system involved in gliding motility auxiliary subunit